MTVAYAATPLNYLIMRKQDFLSQDRYPKKIKKIIANSAVP